MLQGGFIKVWPIDWPWIWVSTWILRSFPGQLLFHPLKLSCEGRSTGLFTATTNCQQATQAGCARYWYAVPRRILFFLSFFFWHHIILTFICHTGLPRCRQQTIPLMCLGCLFAFSNWQWTIKGCFSKRRGTVA